VFDGSNDGMVCVNDSGTPARGTVHIKGKIRSVGGARQIIMESDDGTISDGGTFIYDYEHVAAKYRIIIADSGGANLEILDATSADLNDNVHSLAYDYSQATQADKLDFYQAGTKLGETNTAAGSLSTGTVLGANQWNVGSRNNGASVPANLNLYQFAIYETSQTLAVLQGIAAALQ
jgi:hypothetical protein